MKKTCDNCYNYVLSSGIIRMLHCMEAEYSTKVEECSKHNGENCPEWREQMKISINGKPYRRF